MAQVLHSASECFHVIRDDRFARPEMGARSRDFGDCRPDSVSVKAKIRLQAVQCVEQVMMSLDIGDDKIRLTHILRFVIVPAPMFSILSHDWVEHEPKLFGIPSKSLSPHSVPMAALA